VNRLSPVNESRSALNTLSTIVQFMYYLIKFRRSRQELINLTTFDSQQSGVSEMRTAERANHDDDVEIVPLSAESEDSLRRTHSHYFVETSSQAFSTVL
jgi:hypothetical protein